MFLVQITTPDGATTYLQRSAVDRRAVAFRIRLNAVRAAVELLTANAGLGVCVIELAPQGVTIH